MSFRIKSYLISFSATSAIILLISILFFYFFKQYYYNLFPVVFIIMAILHATLHIILLKNTDIRPQKFINLFLLLTTIKFFFIIITLTIFLYFLNTIALQIGITFLALFLIFLVLEVSVLLKIFKK